MYVSDLKHGNASLGEKLQELYTLNRGKSIDLSFRPPYLELLARFGNPHLELPPVIHVAGTNGKGSTIATLRAILEAGGYKVHAYTSPHLVHFNERIILAGKNISDAHISALIDEAIGLNAGNDITFFEITTAMAFAAFSRTKADILLLETGMGGRLDCTNVVEKPALTIISAIGYDHMDHLGETLEKIAAEKAGIMKPGVPCVIARQRHAGSIPVFEKIAAEKNVPLIRSREWDGVSVLQGSHQRDNTATALTALQILRPQFPLNEEAIERGLARVHWPARLQNITPHIKTPPGWETWLDGGHNEDAAQALAVQLEQWHDNNRPLHLVMAMLKNRDPADFIAPLAAHLQTLHIVPIPGESKAWSPQELAENLKSRFPALPITAHDDYTTALKTITRGNPGRILIAGSLYLAGHVLKTAHISS